MMWLRHGIASCVTSEPICPSLRRYLMQRPADQRAWGNRAENCCKVCASIRVFVLLGCWLVNLVCACSTQAGPAAALLLQANDWQLALECCNEALAIATPTHLVPRCKLLTRQARSAGTRWFWTDWDQAVSPCQTWVWDCYCPSLLLQARLCLFWQRTAAGGPVRL